MKTAAEILAFQDRVYLTVDCPEWVTSIRIGCMTVALKEAWSAETRALVESDSALAAALLIVHTAVDGEGKPLFTREQAAQLRDKSAVVIERLGEAAFKVNKLRRIDLDEAIKN